MTEAIWGIVWLLWIGVLGIWALFPIRLMGLWALWRAKGRRQAQVDPSWRGFWHLLWGHNGACLIDRLIAPSGRYLEIWECHA